MAAPLIAELSDRAVVAVTGAEAVGFLQGLVTADVEALAVGAAGYGALLTPQGKILFDFLALRTDDGFRLDVRRDCAAEFAKRLRFYKLRAKVDVADRSDSDGVWAIWGDDANAEPAAFADPRLAALGSRWIGPRSAPPAPPGATAASLADYHGHRIRLGVPEGGLDFRFGDVFPHDADMDELSGVAFDKGCYVGQEVVSRMKHRGTARRRVVLAEALQGDGLPAAGADIVAGERSIGAMGSSAGRHGLALVRLDRAKEAIDAGRALGADGVGLTLALPAWARFGWPETVSPD